MEELGKVETLPIVKVMAIVLMTTDEGLACASAVEERGWM